MTSPGTSHLHLVSDATGETLNSVARACLVQFEGIEPREHVWSLVRTPNQMERVIQGISDFYDFDTEFAMFRAMVEASGRPTRSSTPLPPTSASRSGGGPACSMPWTPSTSSGSRR